MLTYLKQYEIHGNNFIIRSSSAAAITFVCIIPLMNIAPSSQSIPCDVCKYMYLAGH